MADDESNGSDPSFNFRTRVVQDGYSYWRSKARGGRLPSRRDIDPLEIPGLMPHAVIVDVRREPDLDFRYRLVGTNNVDHHFTDHSGEWFSEIPHQKAPSQIWQNCKRVVETGEPFLANTPYVGPHSAFREAEDIILPLASDGETVDSLLVFIDYLSLDNT